MKWLNRALDKSVKVNLWSVRFEDKENRYDFNTRFIVYSWVHYVKQIYGQPNLRSKGPQMVLEYMYVQPAKVVKAWSCRIYRFTSGTYFTAITIELEVWLAGTD